MADDIDRLRTQVDASILRAALVAIQELHRAVYEGEDAVGCWRCDWEQDGQWPCRTRRFADDALATRTTKNGGAS